MTDIKSFADCANALAATNAIYDEHAADIISRYGSINNYLDQTRIVPVCTPEEQEALAAYYRKYPKTLELKNPKRFLTSVLANADKILITGSSEEKAFAKALVSIKDKMLVFCEANSRNFPLNEQEGTNAAAEIAYIAFKDYLSESVTGKQRTSRCNTLLIMGPDGQPIATVNSAVGASNFQIFSPANNDLTVSAIYFFVHGAFRGKEILSQVLEKQDELAMRSFETDARQALIQKGGFHVICEYDWPPKMTLAEVLANNVGGLNGMMRPIALGRRGFGAIDTGAVPFIYPGYGNSSDYYGPSHYCMPATYFRQVTQDQDGSFKLGAAIRPQNIRAATMFEHYRALYESFETPWSIKQDPDRTSKTQLAHFRNSAGKDGQGRFAVAAQEVTENTMRTWQQRMDAMADIFGHDTDLKKLRVFDYTTNKDVSPLSLTLEHLYSNTSFEGVALSRRIEDRIRINTRRAYRQSCGPAELVA